MVGKIIWLAKLSAPILEILFLHFFTSVEPTSTESSCEKCNSKAFRWESNSRHGKSKLALPCIDRIENNIGIYTS